MAVPFNDLRLRHVRSEDAIIQSFANFVAQGQYVGGPALESFEGAFAVIAVLRLVLG